MRDNAAILLGAGDFIQGPDALMQTGATVSIYGRNALIVADDIPWAKTHSLISASLEANGVSFELFPFEGYCSDSNTEMVAKKVQSMKADVVIGVGGGKCLDTAKWGADRAGVRVITIPTSVATCAAYVALCVLYDDTGTTLKSVFAKREVAAVILDTKLIAMDCPPRYFASGIADALAKEPELYFSIKFSPDWEKSVLPDLGYEIARFNTKRYLAQGEKALNDVKNGLLSSDVEDIVNTNVALTGMVSCLASGGKQLAIAHSLYDCICTHFKPQRAEFLHGEIVSCGIAVQMAVNGNDEESIDTLRAFLKRIGTPTSLKDIGVDPTDENVKIILDYIFKNMAIKDPEIRELIKKYIRIIC